MVCLLALLCLFWCHLFSLSAWWGASEHREFLCIVMLPLRSWAFCWLASLLLLNVQLHLFKSSCTCIVCEFYVCLWYLPESINFSLIILNNFRTYFVRTMTNGTPTSVFLLEPVAVLVSDAWLEGVTSLIWISFHGCQVKGTMHLTSVASDISKCTTGTWYG